MTMRWRWLRRVVACSMVLGAGLGMASTETFAGQDAHSYGNPDQIRVTAVDLALTVDFGARTLRATARLEVERQPKCPEDAPLVLDTRGLTIESVRASVNGKPSSIPFELGRVDPILGAPLSIRLPGAARTVEVAYRTVPEASALQWVAPEQTAGRRHPFLFTQSEAIHARSWIPLQDSPAVRVTYRAGVQVPAGLKAVMSADAAGQQDSNTFKFSMPQPIPPYLIALAVGDLAFRPLGNRTGVWAEPSVVDKAAHEFADTEKMVKAAENRFGPYRWGRYDILVLPPSFPFGGMENAKLTFATPTVLAGDRSMVSLVAHELAHSWSGNLVANSTWRDFWLNEGFTTYLEQRIVEDLYGADRSAMERVLGMKDLREELAKFEQRDQILHIDLNGRNPDDGMTRIPYEKGAAFLHRLEAAFGRDAFDGFLRGYFDRYPFRSITTADFEDYLRSTLFTKDPKAAESINLRAWLHEPGLPSDAIEPHSDRFAAIEQQAERFATGKIAANDLATNGWSTLEWVHFLRALPADLSTERMTDLDRAFHLTDGENSEIAEQWLLIAIRRGYTPADPRLERFLTTIGRRKYLIPLYEALVQTPEGKTRASAIFAKARPRYHPIAAESVDRLLKKNPH